MPDTPLHQQPNRSKFQWTWKFDQLLPKEPSLDNWVGQGNRSHSTAVSGRLEPDAQRFRWLPPHHPTRKTLEIVEGRRIVRRNRSRSRYSYHKSIARGCRHHFRRTENGRLGNDPPPAPNLAIWSYRWTIFYRIKNNLLCLLPFPHRLISDLPPVY